MSFEKLVKKTTIRHRLIEEIRVYAIISLYLWICFGALLLYKLSVIPADDMRLLPFGTAAIKALIIGKFIMIGKALKVGVRTKIDTLLHRIAWKSLAILLLLLICTLLEELIVGLVHGQAIYDMVADLIDRPWLQNVAPSIVMLVVLVPMISFEEIDITLGKGKLKSMLFSGSNSA
jgi:uncharacterized membrane protein YjfL (UPF0719 family)